MKNQLHKLAREYSRVVLLTEPSHHGPAPQWRVKLYGRDPFTSVGEGADTDVEAALSKALKAAAAPGPEVYTSLEDY